MRILFLHGWRSVVGGVKPTFLREAGHEVCNPALDHDHFDLAVRTAQTELERFAPEVIVGSSRGGAVAMNLASPSAPMVLLCPAWKKHGTASSIADNVLVLHSRHDPIIPFSDSIELIARSHLPLDRLIEIGSDHRLADRVSLQTMLNACIRLWSETAWMRRANERASSV